MDINTSMQTTLATIAIATIVTATVSLGGPGYQLDSESWEEFRARRDAEWEQERLEQRIDKIE